MKLSKACICLDCDEIFEELDRCPKCGSAIWRYLELWIKSLKERIPEI